MKHFYNRYWCFLLLILLQNWGIHSKPAKIDLSGCPNITSSRIWVRIRCLEEELRVISRSEGEIDDETPDLEDVVPFPLEDVIIQLLEVIGSLVGLTWGIYSQIELALQGYLQQTQRD